MNFLIVDDDPDILKLVQRLLTHEGHHVHTCETALEALQIAHRGQFDIVLTDATMPQHSGFDLVRSLKKKLASQHLTIAMLTGRSEKNDIEQALELGVNDYIVKPIEPALFMSKINKLIDLHNKQSKPQQDFSHHAPIQVFGNLELPIEIFKITELGIHLRSSQQLNKGLQITLNIPELKEWGIHKNQFKVIFSHQEKDSWINELLILDLDKTEKKRLESFAQSKQKRRSA